MLQTFFHPYTYYQNFELYSYFTQFEYDFTCDILARLFEQERAQPEWSSKVEPRVRAIEADLRHTAVFAHDAARLAPHIVRESGRIFRLEQLALLLALSKPEFFDEIVRVEGLERLREVLREDGTCVLVTPHVGPHFIVTLILAKLGIRVSTGGGITKEFADGNVRIAQFHGIDLGQDPGFVFSDDFRARCAQMIAHGTSIMLYPEYSRSARKGNLIVDFLGNEVHAPTGIARLAQEARRRLVMVTLEPRAPFRYELRLGPVWPAPPVGGEAAVEGVIREIFQQVEQLVVRKPEAWIGWEFFGTMKGNALEIMSRQFASDRAAHESAHGA